MNRNIMLGWLSTQLLYLGWWLRYGRIFGMGDVDNYIAMCGMRLDYVTFRHVFMSYLSCHPVVFVFLLPAVYWFGIVWLLYLRYGGDHVFVYVFGTASMPLFFVLGLWSQHICIMFLLLWDLLRHHSRVLSLGCLLAALTYIPVFGYLASLYAWSVFLFGIMAAFPIGFFQYSYPQSWFPLASLVFYVCPIVWLPLFFGSERYNAKWRATFAILSLQYLGRLQIFMHPHLEIRLNNLKRLIIIVWYIVVTAYFLHSMHNEAYGIAGLARVIPYG